MKYKINELLTSALLILIILALGLFVVNQFLGYMYKVQFLKAPCSLCVELNPEVEKCIDLLNAPRNIYPMNGGKWSEPIINKTIMNLTIPLT
jgi:hypothetical protein